MKPLELQMKQEFIKSACFRIDESLRMIEKCFLTLDEADLWLRPNTVSNSIGNLVLHLKGNITQYAVSSLTGLPDTRERDKEFSTTGKGNKAELLQSLKETLAEAKRSFQQCTLDELLRSREVQGFQLTGLGIIIHVVEHLSYHTGQIAYWTKILKERELGFYDGIDLTIRNK